MRCDAMRLLNRSNKSNVLFVSLDHQQYRPVGKEKHEY